MNPELDQANKYLLISVCGQIFAVPSTSVVEITAAIRPTKLPFVPHYIAGLVNIKGSVIPLLSLSAYMGIQHLAIDKEKAESIFIIVLSGNTHFALAADAAIDEVTEVDDTMIVLDIQQFHNIIQPTEHGDANNVGLLGKTEIQEYIEEKISLLVFQNWGERFGFALDEIVEVVEVDNVITPVPGAPECVLGMITLHDSALPVLSFPLLVGKNQLSPADKKLLVVIEREGTHYGIDISTAVAINSFFSSCLKKSPNELGQFSSVLIDAYEQVTLLVKANELIPDDLHKKLKELAPATMSKGADIIKTRSLLHVTINNLSYAMSLDYVRMVTTARKVAKVNDAADQVLGVVEIEGRIISLLNTSHIFGAMDMQAAALQYVIIGDEKTEWALPVNQINEILDIPEMDIENITSATLKHLSGIAHHYKADLAQLIPVLDVLELYPRG